MPPIERAERQRAVPAPAPGRADPSWIGKCIQGRYRIEEQLGAGGVGTVYRAVHLALGRAVALKVLRKQHNERWVSRKRFEREAQALAQVAHPHIVAISDCGMDEDVPFLVMELLEGESLEARLRRGPLAPALACSFGLELLEGLAFIHERGLVHRDIKPGNVFLERTVHGAERLKILDFGLAKLVVQSADAAVTRSGEVLGTPAYMSPEQVTGEVCDARTDVYAVGLLLFEMIAGRRPFQGSESEILRQQLVEPMPLLSEVLPRAGLNPGLDLVLQRATDKEKDQRFADAQSMASALGKALPRAGGSTRPASLGVRSPAQPHTPRGRASRRGSLLGRVLRGGAVLLSGLALAAIVIAAGLIYWLESPDGEAGRVQVKRALPSLLDEPKQDKPKPRRSSRQPTREVKELKGSR
jgi:serine/threonine-protein kinase